MIFCNKTYITSTDDDSQPLCFKTLYERNKEIGRLCLAEERNLKACLTQFLIDLKLKVTLVESYYLDTIELSSVTESYMDSSFC